MIEIEDKSIPFPELTDGEFMAHVANAIEHYANLLVSAHSGFGELGKSGQSKEVVSSILNYSASYVVMTLATLCDNIELHDDEAMAWTGPILNEVRRRSVGVTHTQVVNT